MQLKRGRACLGITVKRLFLFLFCCFVFVVVNVVRKKTWFLFCTIGRTRFGCLTIVQKNKLVSAQWLHLSASTEDLFSEGASRIIPPPNLTIKTGRRIIKRGGWRAVKTFWSRDGEGGLGFGCGRCRLEQGTGLQMQASLSYHWGDLFFFDLHGKDLQHVLGEERTRLPWRGWAGLPWRSWTRLLWRWTTTRSWASPWGLVPEEREEGSRSPGRKNFLGCAGPKITREIITKTIMIKSTICSPRVTFGLSRLAPLDRLGCGWPRPAESPLLCLFNAGPAWEWYISYKH